MKDENGIEICCENCRCVCKYDSMCLAHTPPSFFRPTSEALEARIAELQNSLDETEKKLTETIKLLGERSRECGELEAYNEVLQRRVQEFSMELLDQNMRDNKDVLERLKNWEEYLDKDLSTQSTDAADVSKKSEKWTCQIYGGGKK